MCDDTPVADSPDTPTADETAPQVVWLNGALTPAAEATISALDHGLVAGDAVFETVRIVSGQPFALTRHLRRLTRSAGAMGLPTVDETMLARAVRDTVTANPSAHDRLRITLTGGVGPLGSARGHGPCTVVIATSGGAASPGVTDAVVVPWRRNEHGALTGVKSTSYAENVIALAEAHREGAGEALFLNTAGEVCEGTGSNLFLVVDDTLVTPHLASGCLDGVTRQLVVELADAQERLVSQLDLGRATEAFLTSTMPRCPGHRPHRRPAPRRRSGAPDRGGSGGVDDLDGHGSRPLTPVRHSPLREPLMFDAATTADEVLAGRDLTNHTAVVTGGTGGIGIETARALAAAGATVVVAGRDPGKLDVAELTIAEAVPGASVHTLTLDLTDLASCRRAGAVAADRFRSIQYLVNNAGVMATPFARTADGFELQFGTNHLGHFVFTGHAIGAVLAGAPARIVNVSSGGHMGSDIVWDDPNYEGREYTKWGSYGQSKTANILFAVELNRRYADRGVQAYSLHPGMIATDLGRHMGPADYAELKERASKGPSGGLPAYKSVGAGAATSVWACVAPELDGHGGAYLSDCAVTDQHAPWARNEASARRLWALSEQLVGVSGFPADS